MQQQLDAIRAAEYADGGSRGLRKPQHKHKFQVLGMDKSYVWHQMLNHSGLANKNPMLVAERVGHRALCRGVHVHLCTYLSECLELL